MFYPLLATLIIISLILFKKRIKEILLCVAILFVLLLPSFESFIDVYFNIPLSKFIHINNETAKYILYAFTTFFKQVAMITSTVISFYFLYQNLKSFFILEKTQKIEKVSKKEKNIPSNSKIGTIFTFEKPNMKLTA